MRSRNYRKEIGANSSDRPVPPVVAFVILAVVAVVAIVFIRRMMADQPAHQETAAVPAPVKVSSR